MVRLLPSNQAIFGRPLHRFNPTMVRLLRFCFSMHPALYKCFNPTIVRLLPTSQRHFWNTYKAVSIPQWCDCCRFCPMPLSCLSHLFQSHNGAIAAHKVCENRLPPSRVSIPQWCDCCKMLEGDFYALMRLEFQSHNGAIAAMCK